MLSMIKKNRSRTMLHNLKNWYKAEIIEKYLDNKSLLIKLSWVKSCTMNYYRAFGYRGIELVFKYK